MPRIYTISRPADRKPSLEGIGTTHVFCVCIVFMVMVFVAGCAATRETTKSPRSPAEQLLLTQSLQRGLAEASLPLDPQDTVFVETIGLTADQGFAAALVTSWVGQQGMHIKGKSEEARYHMKVHLHAFGTEKEVTFFGLPPSTSVLIPFSLPEITVYGATRQIGYAQFSFDIIDSKNGHLLRSTPAFEGSSQITSYVVMLFFSFKTTDLSPPPL